MAGQPSISIVDTTNFEANKNTKNKQQKTKTPQVVPREKQTLHNLKLLLRHDSFHPSYSATGHVSQYQCWYTSHFVLPPATHLDVQVHSQPIKLPFYGP